MAMLWTKAVQLLESQRLQAQGPHTEWVEWAP